MTKRVLIGIGLVGVFFAMLLLGDWVRCAVLSVAAVCAVREMRGAFEKKGLRPCLWPAYTYAALYYALGLLDSTLGYTLALGALCLAAAMGERIVNPRRTQEDAFAALAAFAYPLALFTAMMRVLTLEYAEVFMLLLFAPAVLGDTLAFFVGSAIGKKKLCPAISPKKTVEGSVGGFLGGILGGLLVCWLSKALFGLSYSLPLALVIGLIEGGVGQLGDLFASTIKRWAGIKDFSNLFGPHGGVIDRLDSELLCAPVLYAILTLAA